MVGEDSYMTADAGEGACSVKKIDGKMKDVAASAGNKHIFGLDMDGKLFHRGGVFGKWEPQDEGVAGSFKEVDINGDGTEVWAVANDGVVWLRQGYNSDWEKLTGTVLTFITVSADSESVWGATVNSNIFWRPGKKIGNNAYWRGVGGVLSQVGVSGNGLTTWAINPKGDTFCNKGPGTHAAAWNAMSRAKTTGIKMKMLDVAADASRVWAVSSDDKVYYRDACSGNCAGCGGEWIDSGVSAAQLSVAGYGDRVWATTVAGDVLFITC